MSGTAGVGSVSVGAPLMQPPKDLAVWEVPDLSQSVGTIHYSLQEKHSDFFPHCTHASLAGSHLDPFSTLPENITPELPEKEKTPERFMRRAKCFV